MLSLKPWGKLSLICAKNLYIYVKEFLLQYCLQCDYVETNCNLVGE